MAHEIDMSNGRANVAYTGQTPWHGLGFNISPDASVEEWRAAAGLDWEIRKAGLLARLEDGKTVDASVLNRSVLYRSDTNALLSVMSTRNYYVVQPDQILSFIGDSVRAMGWKMETAGSLRGGRKIWALANLGKEAEVGKGDSVRGYLLAATACDGSMTSEFMFTSVRVVCNNTLQMATDGRNGQSRVKVYHYNTLNVNAVKSSLGIAADVWSGFIERTKALVRVKLSEKKAVQVLRGIYEPREKVIVGDEILTDEQFLSSNNGAAARQVLELFSGAGLGSELTSARGTAWGLVNATTQFYDHVGTAVNDDNRLNSAWFGRGAQRKQQVLDACMKMAA